jgi:hypothetical protein
MRTFNTIYGNRVKVIFTIMLFIVCNQAFGQGSSYSYYYRVYFRDKGDHTVADYAPGDLLSVRAIDRREKADFFFRIKTSLHFKVDEYGTVQNSIACRYKSHK